MRDPVYFEEVIILSFGKLTRFGVIAEVSRTGTLIIKNIKGKSTGTIPIPVEAASFRPVN
jgi:hypothetical protein